MANLQTTMLMQGRRKRGGRGGLSPPNNFCVRQSKTLRLVKCEPNLDSLKKMKEPRLALSMLLAHVLQAISESLFSSTAGGQGGQVSGLVRNIN